MPKNRKDGAARPGVEHSLGRLSSHSSAQLRKHSLSVVAEGFLLKCKLEDLLLSTIKDHARKLGRFVEYCHDCPISDVSPLIIREFLGSLKDQRGLDIVTVQRHLVSIKAFFNWACEEGFIVYPPTHGVRVGGIVNKVVRSLSEDEIRRLLEAVKAGSSALEVRNCAIVHILLDCGLRISELMNLKLGDVNQQRGVLRVRGKGYKERLVRMGFGTQKALWKYMVMRQGATDWLWENDEGNKYDKSGVQHWLKVFGKRRLGIRLYAHLLRHTFAISFLRNGGNVFALQAALGHSSLEMTRRYCQALGFEDVFKAHEIASPVDNILKEHSKPYSPGSDEMEAHPALSSFL